jgi:hypothetical protein
MPATLTTVSSLLKEVYEEDVQEQLNNDVIALKRIERSSDGVTSEVGGKYVTFPIHTRRNSGIGARNELEALPTAGQQGFTGARIGLKYLYGLVRLSGQTMELADSNFQAFASALDAEVNGLKADLAKDLNRQVYGNGSGAISTAGTASGPALTFTPVAGKTIYAQLGEQVDLIDGTTLGNPSPTVKSSNRQITAINTSTGVITVDSNITVAVGDILVRTGSVNREWTGLSKIVAGSGTLYNVDPTVEPLWVSSVDSNGGTNRALSEGLMINMVDGIRQAGGKVTVILGNLGVRRAYFNLLTQQRRYSNTKEFAGGFTGLTFTTDQGEVPMVTDVDAPRNTLFFLNEDELTWYREKDWSWMNRDGSNWQRVIGFDAYEATMYQYSELGTHRRNTHGLMSDITEG